MGALLGSKESHALFQEGHGLVGERGKVLPELDEEAQGNWEL